ncbi:DUF3158 family protein [Pseudomonas fluorescens]|uniref:DUF3158 family protein n=1 Tax=Pseudomonas fluorescens TaxID=294 RepID=UPI001BEB3244|nr:DUF3158 family protein [Pseudomonas fluorescens]MBT2375406.1 DUF3158 family protein [Pseudomonas fluorescens]
MSASYFTPLAQADYQALAHSAYLKGLLQPFTGKGLLATWAGQCFALRDELIELACHRILAQARAYPFNRLPVQLCPQITGAGTTFLRWRNVSRTAMGVGLWEELLADPATPAVLLGDLLALEQQRISLNLQISLSHSLARQAEGCAQKSAHADAVYQQHVHRPTPPSEDTPS